ncbi:MAG TPA: hypothetical protein VN397_01365, partial [Candidatus Methylomirabilis sp.]|nr:hypothetical protein [Candidatus Methylomirabilis sp.]
SHALISPDVRITTAHDPEISVTEAVEDYDGEIEEISSATDEPSVDLKPVASKAQAPVARVQLVRRPAPMPRTDK